MTWVPLLLASPSPCLRKLVLQDLLHTKGKEVIHLTRLCDQDQLVTQLVNIQNENGSWGKADIAGLTLSSPVLNTSQALIRLGYLGFDCNYPAVKKGAEYLFSQQRDNGSWGPPDDPEIENEYVITPLQTALPLRGLAYCGYSTDTRAEKAYTWLFNNVLPDGAWPTRVTKDGSYGYRAGYRAIPHSRFGCRSNTTGVLHCLALHPDYRHNPLACRALDLLLARETQDAHVLGFEVARIIGVEKARGFLTYFARFDLGLILELSWRIGATLEDERVRTIVKFVQNLQTEYGLWEYTNPQASRWITFDLLRSLSYLDETGDWISLEPRTPFEGYPRIRKRY